MAGEWINKGEQSVPIKLADAERAYRAEYVADLCVKLPSGNWSEEPVAVFWVEKPEKPEYSNYFGIFVREGKAMICNGITAVQDGDGAPVVFRAALAKNGEIVFSRWRHDCRLSKDKTAMADGGRDYFRGHGQPIFLKVEGPEFTIMPDIELVREPT